MYYKYFHIPILQTLLKQAKVIPICSAKEDPEVLEDAFRSIRTALEEGEVVCIFPEGQLTPDGERTPFRQGVCKIIEETPVPVIPMSLSGMWGASSASRKGALDPSHQSVLASGLAGHPSSSHRNVKLCVKRCD